MSKLSPEASAQIDEEPEVCASNRLWTIPLMLMTISFLIAAGSPVSASPSFDCGRASTPVEKTICGNKLLSDLDSALSEAFTERRHDLPDTDVALFIKDEQYWLKERDKRCSAGGANQKLTELRQINVECLIGEFHQRIETLRIWSRSDARARVLKAGPYRLTTSREPTLCGAMLEYYDLKINFASAGFEKWLADHEIVYQDNIEVPVIWREDLKPGEYRNRDTLAIYFDLFHEGDGRIIYFEAKWAPHSGAMVGMRAVILKAGAVFTYVRTSSCCVDIAPDLIDIYFDPDGSSAFDPPIPGMIVVKSPPKDTWLATWPYSVFMIAHRGDGYFVLQSQAPSNPPADVVRIEKDGTVTSVCYIE